MQASLYFLLNNTENDKKGLFSIESYRKWRKGHSLTEYKAQLRRQQPSWTSLLSSPVCRGGAIPSLRIILPKLFRMTRLVHRIPHDSPFRLRCGSTLCRLLKRFQYARVGGHSRLKKVLYYTEVSEVKWTNVPSNNGGQHNFFFFFFFLLFFNAVSKDARHEACWAISMATAWVSTNSFKCKISMGESRLRKKWKRIQKLSTCHQESYAHEEFVGLSAEQ